MEKSINVYQLAPEVWTIIFDKLQQAQGRSGNKSFSGNDLLNCSRVCRTFLDILSGTKCLWLFQEVLPLIVPFLDGQSLLPLRATCKSWEHAVDHFIQFNDHHEPVEIENGQFVTMPIIYSRPTPLQSNSCHLSLYNSICSFHSNAKIVRFLECVDTSQSTRNPFPGAALHLQFIASNWEPCSQANTEQFWNVNVIQLLCGFGENVLTLVLKLQGYSQEDYSLPELRQSINTILAFVPNIRTLRIQAHIKAEIRGWQEGVNCLVDRLEHSLPHLECIEFKVALPPTKVLPLSLQLRISGPYFSQLKRLKLCVMDASPRVRIPGSGLGFSPDSLPNLEELELTLLSSLQLAIILHLASNSAKLRKIFAEFSHTRTSMCRCGNSIYGSDDDIPNTLAKEKCLNLYDILRPLLQKCFAKSLVSLSVVAWGDRLPYASAEQSDLDSLSGFSSLKYLRIEGFKFLDLRLGGCLPASLQFLFVSAWWDSARNLVRVSLDLASGESVYDCKLWTELRHLRMLGVGQFLPTKFTYCRYRRENWEWLMRSTGQQQKEISSATGGENGKREAKCCAVT